MKQKITASAVKSWFQYRCDRKNVYESMHADERATIPIVEDAAADSPWATFGNEFEERVVAKLRQVEPVLSPAPGDRYVPLEVAKAFLSRSSDERYAHQLSLVETRSLRRTLGIQQLPDVRIGMGLPDLVRVEFGPSGVPLFHLIDVKATQFATLFHKAQVAFYALMLRANLQEIGASGEVAKDAEIWHMVVAGDHSDEVRWETTSFALRGYEEIVADFFHRDVPRLADYCVRPGARDPTFFHLYFKCEQCKFVSHCEQSIGSNVPTADRDLSAVPGMSHQAKKALHQLDVRTVGSLAESAGLSRLIDRSASWSLRNRAEQFRERAAALLSGEIRRLPDRLTWLMPAKIDIAFHLVVDVDPVAGNLAALGYLRSDHRGNRPSVAVVRVLESGSEAEEQEALLDVLGRLAADLVEVDAHNRRPGGSLHTHIFTYEPVEARDLQSALTRHVEVDAIRRGLLELIRIFPTETALPEPGYRHLHHLPATALRSVIESIYALPVQVAHDLRNVTQALSRATPGLDAPYEPSDSFARRFSSRLSIDVSRAIRSRPAGAGDTSPTTAEVESDVRSRLDAMDSLARWILQDNARASADFLRLNKAPFRLQDSIDPFEFADLDVLLALQLLESRGALLSTLTDLAAPARVRRDRCNCMANLRLLKKGPANWGRYWLLFQVPPESRDAMIPSGTFGAILTDNDPDKRLDPLQWPSHSVSIVPPREGDGGQTILLSMTAAVHDADPMQALLRETAQDGWFLDKTYVSITADRLEGFLRFLGEREPE